MLTPIAFEWLEVGHCRHLECMAQRHGRWKSVRFPCHVGLLVHPTEGLLVFDTGYHDAFFSATQPFPERLYRVVTPITLGREQTLLAQLEARGHSPHAVRRVVLSHLHADHVAGITDFPDARITVMRCELQAMRKKSRFDAVRHAYLPALFPREVGARLEFAEDRPVVELPRWMSPFATGFDLIGDGSLLGVPLPGHTAGQMGLLFTSAPGRPIFLVADACWTHDALIADAMPNALASLLFDDRRRYRETFTGLRQLACRETAIRMLPSHCASSALAFAHEPA